MKSAVIVASLVLALAGTAAAQPGMTPAMASPPSQPLPPPPPAEALSENTALALSLGGTAASWAILVSAAQLNSQGRDAGNLAWIGFAGTVLAPSFGHWYAHSVATRGLGLRLAGVGSFTVALALAVRCEDECSGAGPIEGAALLGLGLFIAGTIDDIATAPRAARHYNEQLSGLYLVPLVRPGTGGLALGGRF